MKVFFSATTNGFYPEQMRADYEQQQCWPDDAREVSVSWYQYLLESQTGGKVITSNEYGQPVLSDPPQPDQETLAALAASKKAALVRAAGDAIAPLQDAVNLGMATDKEKMRLTEWLQYRVLLNRIDTSAAPDITWPEVPGDVA
ncbi:tail fiber assembly protein [Cronobacter turicensis]|uniref:tail fiber assembly protein n=1 Tax=Cronobacter turicensis TaxID=413502 RepID=UPI0024C25482|nr:tail fiber assembly protein [Cronobacter turicensis]MDK1334445.1 tail fiber assembly protein [Cronobacter turicensis]